MRAAASYERANSTQLRGTAAVPESVTIRGWLMVFRGFGRARISWRSWRNHFCAQARWSLHEATVDQGDWCGSVCGVNAHAERKEPMKTGPFVMADGQSAGLFRPALTGPHGLTRNR